MKFNKKKLMPKKDHKGFHRLEQAIGVKKLELIILKITEQLIID